MDKIEQLKQGLKRDWPLPVESEHGIEVDPEFLRFMLLAVEMLPELLADR